MDDFDELVPSNRSLWKYKNRLLIKELRKMLQIGHKKLNFFSP